MNQQYMTAGFVILAIMAFVFSTVLFANNIPQAAQTPTAKASIDIGQVTLDISGVLSITLLNSSIDFGSCAVNLTRSYTLLDSELNETQANNFDCIGGSYPSSMWLQNDGTIVANVTVMFNQTGANFFNDSNSWFAYKTINHTSVGGCNSSRSSYTNISVANTPLQACDHLAFGQNTNSFLFYMQAFVTENATSSGDLRVDFTATIS